jgi:hypothetical protein
MEQDPPPPESPRRPPPHVDRPVDSPSLDVVLQTLPKLGIDGDDMDGVFKMMGAIVLLSEVVLCPKDDAADGGGGGSDDVGRDDRHEKSKVAATSGPRSAAEPFDCACALLGLDRVHTEKRLCNRTMKMRSEAYVIGLSVKEAEDSRDALCKTLYSKTFEWLVRKMNSTLRPSADIAPSRLGSIGILDIFGFESFQVWCMNILGGREREREGRGMYSGRERERRGEGRREGGGGGEGGEGN